MLRTKIVYWWHQYQRGQYYASVAEGEYLKPLRFLSITASLLTLFKVYGLNIPLWVVGVAQIPALLLAMVIGYGIVKTNAVKVSNTVANEQNEELKEIVTWVRKQNGTTNNKN